MYINIKSDYLELLTGVKIKKSNQLTINEFNGFDFMSVLLSLSLKMNLIFTDHLHQTYFYQLTHIPAI